MTPKLAWRRRLAHRVLLHSAVVFPSERSSWAEAMRIEARHIDDDREALRWALGSLYAGYAERLRAMRAHKMLSAHSLAVLWIIMFMVSSAFNFGIALAARLRYQGVTSALGSLIAGFRYNRFVPLADAMPRGLLALMGMIVVLFTVALCLSLRRRPAAFAAFCCAVGLSLGAWLYELGIPAYVQAMSPQHLWRIGICFVLTAGVLRAAWLGGAAQGPPHRRLDRSGP